MDLSSQKCISNIRWCLFLVAGYHFSFGMNDSLAFKWATLLATFVLYLLLVFAMWQRARTTAAWAIPLAFPVFGLAVGWVIISIYP